MTEIGEVDVRKRRSRQEVQTAGGGIRNHWAACGEGRITSWVSKLLPEQVSLELTHAPYESGLSPVVWNQGPHGVGLPPAKEGEPQVAEALTRIRRD